jgi:dTDP-L-rhamnose 4-epimerase
MPFNILITGGAGFIGSHLADELLAAGHRVRAYDSLLAQVHGPNATRPAYLDREVELMVGDVRDRAGLQRALHGIDVVYHLAAMVGVGQSMYEVARYTDVNNRGTATLLDLLIQKPVERLIVASSMSIYGEGLYRSAGGTPVPGVERTLEQLKAAEWEVRDAAGNVLDPLPTPESKAPVLPSVYALSKYDQERLCLLVGRAYGMPAVALRFFNTYGPRQALSNPYSGVLAIFASRVLNGKRPLINEDGRQRRDFVSVHDVVSACRLALERDGAAGGVFNVASGASYTVAEAAAKVAGATGRGGLAPQITGQYRFGDIRHCFADISLANKVLGYRPRVTLDAGLDELAGWLESQVAEDRVEAAQAEMLARGLGL